VFAGLITLVSMGFFQDLTGDQRCTSSSSRSSSPASRSSRRSSSSRLMLAVDPAQVTKNVEHGVLLPRTSPSRPRPDGRPVDPSELVDEPSARPV
jgi:hypothetical protein